MTQEKMFPRVFEPQSIREFSTISYQALYENNDEAKRYLKIVEMNYCSPISTLGENEKLYMQRYISKAFHLAKKMKKTNRRNFVRKEMADFNKETLLEEAKINRNRYLRSLEEIKSDELEKTKNIFGRAAKTLPPLTSSTSFALSCFYLNIPKEPSALVAGIVGVTTYAGFKVFESRKAKKAIQDCCEAQRGAEKYYTDRVKQIEKGYSDELLAIEGDKESETRKHISKEIKDLKKVWKFYGIDAEKTDFGEYKNIKLIAV